MIKVSTFCSGIGAAEQAFKNLDVPHEVVFACEIDKYARMSYEANHSAETMYEDMTQHDYVDSKYYSDINISGIPCQAFSLAGLRKGENDSRGLLFYDFYRYVKNQQPKIFIIENVKGLLSADKGVIFQNWIELLGRSVNGHEKMFLHEDSLEYNLHHTVLNSKNFGVPQNRERVFIVGIRKDLPNDFRFPIGWKLDNRLRDVLEPEVDEKYYLSEKMINNIMTPSGGDWNSGKMQIDREIATALSATMHKMHRADTDNYVSDEINKIGFINQDTQASQVYGTDGISPTLTSGTHGYAQGYIKEPFCVAMRGRNLENKNDRTAGANLKQTLEINSQGTTNCLSTVQKDNLIVEPQVINPLKDKTEFGWHFEQNVFDVNGITRALKSSEGSGNKLKIIEPQLNQVAQIDGFESEGRVYDANGIARTIKDGGGGGAKTGWYKVEDPELNIIGNVFESGGQAGKIYNIDSISPTVSGQRVNSQGYLNTSRIRRLTPLECFRLQAFGDEFFHKAKSVNSDTQLYKQAGNSITVTVLESIIKNLLHLLQ